MSTDLIVQKRVEPMAQCAMNIRTIPWHLRQKFKVLCAMNGITVEQGVIAIMQATVYRGGSLLSLEEVLSDAALIG